jgi:hypothetical protein
VGYTLDSVADDGPGDFFYLPDESVNEQLLRACKVIAWTSTIVAFLTKHDPTALDQVRRTISQAAGAPARATPRVLVTVRGGVGDFAADPGVRGPFHDYDNADDPETPAEERQIPPESADLAEVPNLTAAPAG